MIYPSLADYLEALAESDELVRISTEVDSDLEIAEITSRVVRAHGPALLFERVSGCDMAIVTNLFGSSSRVCKALGVSSLEEIPEAVAALSGPEGSVPSKSPAGSSPALNSPTLKSPGSWLGRWTPPFAGLRVERLNAKEVKVAACQQVVQLGRDVDLEKLPALRSWPDESVRSITSGLAFSRDIETGETALERPPIAITSPRTLGVMWDPYGGLQAQWEAWCRRGESMPVSIVLGGDPLAMLLAEFPLPLRCDPFAFLGAWRGESFEIVKCRSHDGFVPAEADLVIEGFVRPATAAKEGRAVKLAAPTGYYYELTPMHEIDVQAVTLRANPIFPATVPGPPPSEQGAVQEVIERLVLSLFQHAVPEVEDLSLPAFGPRGQFIVVAVRKRYTHQARSVASALWGFSYTMRSKGIIVVDDDVDIRNLDDVMYRVSANVDPGRDIFFQEGLSDLWDHATTVSGPRRGERGNKFGLDATSKWPEECGRSWPTRTVASPRVCDIVAERWGEYGLAEEILGNRESTPVDRRPAVSSKP